VFVICIEKVIYRTFFGRPSIELYKVPSIKCSWCELVGQIFKFDMILIDFNDSSSLITLVAGITGTDGT
jgi:hypothetical protein